MKDFITRMERAGYTSRQSGKRTSTREWRVRAKWITTRALAALLGEVL